MKRPSTMKFAVVAAGLLVSAVAPGPALPQDSPKEAPSQQSPEQPSVRPPKGAGAEARDNKRRGPVVRIDLVVDSVKLTTWDHEDLHRIAEEVDVKWRPRGKGPPHPAIPVWYLLEDGGVAKDTVTEVRIVSGGKPRIFKGDTLGYLDQAVLRTAAKAKGPAVWRLSTMYEPDTDNEKAVKAIGSLPKIRRIEVVTGR